MKKRTILFSLICIVALNAFSQMIVVTDTVVNIDKKLVPGLCAEIHDESDQVRKSFIKFIKDQFEIGTKKKGKRSVQFEQGIIATISPNSGDLWCTFESSGASTTINLVFFIGYDIAIQKVDYPDETDGMRAIIADFIVHYETNRLNELIESNTKRLAGLSQDLKKSERELENTLNQITKIDKSLGKDPDEDKKFELSNEKIELKAKSSALGSVIENLKAEINSVNEDLKVSNDDLIKVQMEAIELGL